MSTHIRFHNPQACDVETGIHTMVKLFEAVDRDKIDGDDSTIPFKARTIANVELEEAGISIYFEEGDFYITMTMDEYQKLLNPDDVRSFE